MKTIVVVRDEDAFWHEIDKLLVGVNAEIRRIVSVPQDPGVPDRVGLIIVGVRTFMADPDRFRQWPTLVLTEGIPPDTVIRDEAGRKLVILGWPSRPETFLEETARLLEVSERRMFAALVRVFCKRESYSFIGSSREFSMTGMSFTLATPLKMGEQVEISFTVPGVERSTRFEAEVVRSFVDPADQSSCYGVCYSNLTREARDVLTRFIMNKST